MRVLLFRKTIYGGFALLLLIIFIITPGMVSAGIKNGLIICFNILIPSIFPFSVVSVFISKIGALSNATRDKFSYYFIILIMSILGGYPIGAKILSEEFSGGKILKSDTEKALRFCVNAGPSFVISFVGYSVFSSRKIGVLIFLSLILSSFTVFLITLPKLHAPNTKPCESLNTTAAEAFVNSVASSTQSMLIICGYSVLFAGILNAMNYNFLPLKLLKYSLEITNSVLNIKNIYAAAFLLGFSGISVICQIISLSKSFIEKYGIIILFRVIHGILSLPYLFLLVKIFKPDIAVFKNTGNSPLFFSIPNAAIGILILLCGTCLIYTLQTKRYTGKFLKDII